MSKWSKPYVGAIVHYRFDADVVRAAIVTRVWEVDERFTTNQVNLQVFLDGQADHHMLDAEEVPLVKALRLATVTRVGVPRGTGYREWSWPDAA